MEVPELLKLRNRLSLGNPSEEVDLTLRLGQPNHHKANQEAPGDHFLGPHNFFNMNIHRYYNQFTFVCILGLACILGLG
ncbi:hypothetical protein U1Q18_033812 [Sarracenia purpurea var. burkii]